MKLELKHLAIEYGGIVDFKRGGFEIKNIDLKNCSLKYANALKEYFLQYKDVSYGLFDTMPHRIPLSDLTDEQKETLKELVNGSNAIKHHYVSTLIRDNLPLNHVINKTPYCIIQKLQQWHFDIYGLINEELAIDINTL